MPGEGTLRLQGAVLEGVDFQPVRVGFPAQSVRGHQLRSLRLGVGAWSSVNERLYDEDNGEIANEAATR